MMLKIELKKAFHLIQEVISLSKYKNNNDNTINLVYSAYHHIQIILKSYSIALSI